MVSLAGGGKDDLASGVDLLPLDEDQKRIGRLLFRGKSQREIAAELSLSDSQVTALKRDMTNRLRGGSEPVVPLLARAAHAAPCEQCGARRAGLTAPARVGVADLASGVELLPLKAAQKRIARLILLGKSQRKIVEELSISASKVKRRLRDIRNRIRAGDDPTAVALAKTAHAALCAHCRAQARGRAGIPRPWGEARSDPPPTDSA